MSCTLCTKRGIPCIRSSTTTDACDACRQAHKKCSFVVRPFRPRGQRSSRPRRPREDSFVVDDDETFASVNGRRAPKQADGNDSGQLALSPPVLICPLPLLGHHPMVTSLLDRREVIIQPMKDGNGKRTFELGPIITMSCHPWDSNAKVNTPVPSSPCKQTLRQPTPRPSGTRWSEDLFREPSQHDEPPIPGPSPSSEPPEDLPTREPEPEVAPTQSTEESFARPGTPHSIIVIEDTPVGSPPPPPPSSSPTPQPSPDLPPIAAENPTPSSPPVPSSSHSYDDACQEFTDLRPILMIP
ncbi:hypothetical protein O181_122283 [Austropuccinia psidii MF-1]|uniref:Zn(2)-C6 fungal-type domain-containing protein n=1 Tax=Austropuccinia psidii MF-1 TaxID=1389203 RepID=A0A9Q3KJ44_9BASI|nr:hypothetical protein [Austropuccinia psidii MF-1]